MQVRRLVNNDYSFGSSRADILEGLDACVQSCKTNLMQLQGEWFLNYRDGVAWGNVLGHKPSSARVAELIKQVLIKVDGVKSVDRIDVDIDGRYAYVIARINTSFGEVDFNQSLNILELIADDKVNQ